MTEEDRDYLKLRVLHRVERWVMIIAIILTALLFHNIVHAESAVIPFTSAEGLKASVDSVLKAHPTKIDYYGVLEDVHQIDLLPAELVAMTIPEPIAPYDSIGDIKIPEGKIDSTADGKIIRYDQEYYFVVQKDGKKLWGHKAEGGKALIYWK
jgi:hypothetical protein